MIELGTIRDLVAIFGVIAGFSYYVLTVRNTLKNQQQQLETRQAQLYMQLMDKDTSQEFQKLAFDMRNTDISDYEEHRNKLNTDRDYNAKYTAFMFHLDNVGHMLETGLIDPEIIFRIGAGGWGPIGAWSKWKPYIMYVRSF